MDLAEMRHDGAQQPSRQQRHLGALAGLAIPAGKRSRAGIASSHRPDQSVNPHPGHHRQRHGDASIAPLPLGQIRQHHAHQPEVDPAALAALDQRLAAWLSLARRHRCAPEALPERLAQWKQALADLERHADIDALQQQEQQTRQDFLQAAQKLSVARGQAAERLAQEISTAMQGLGMAGGRFDVRLQPLEQPQAHGLENIEFLVAGHPGSTPRPVGKVASGGELSRIALAISVTTSQVGQAPTLIFDEVDAGIGGAVAQTVGRLMRQLGRDRQVLAVTHLAQVAACADHHLQVAKRQDAQGTASEVTVIESEARVQELARMLGGDKLSDASLAHAREMLQA